MLRNLAQYLAIEAISVNDSIILVFFLLIALFVLWILYLSPRAQAAREDRKRQEAEELARRAAEKAKLVTERDNLAKSIRTSAPGFILDARQDFERQFRTGGGAGQFGHEMSPLVCFGYRVGKTNGRSETERQSILKYALVADLDVTLKFLPVEYRREWGAPLSIQRFNRIFQHLGNLAELRDGRRNYAVAVSHWRSDARWFRTHHRPTVEKFSAI